MGKGGRKRGTGSVGPKKRNGRKGVGTQGRHYAWLMMRESEGEKAVHAYNVTAHVLHKGSVLIIEISFLAPLLCIEFAIFVSSYLSVYDVLSCVTLRKCNTP